MYRLNYEQFDRDNQYIGNDLGAVMKEGKDRKSTRLNSSHAT